MPDDPRARLARRGWAGCACAAGGGGIVRGFTGFGTALIFMPVAGQILSPFGAITIAGRSWTSAGRCPTCPAPARDGRPRGCRRLGDRAMMLAMPLGMSWPVAPRRPPRCSATDRVDRRRWSCWRCSGRGWRYRGALTRPLIFGTGALSGFLSGSAGLPGPPVILLYMASATGRGAFAPTRSCFWR